MAELRRRLQSIWQARTTVRGRATVLAMVVVSVTLALALTGVLLLYRSQLQSGLDQTLEQQATDRARLLDQGSSPTSLTTVLQEEALVWIGSPDGEAAAIGGAILPLENPVPIERSGVRTLDLLVEERKPDEIERERMALRVAIAATADPATVVLVGAENEVVGEDVSGLARLFAGALPVLVGLVGATTWFVAGRVLEPVERVRAQAAEISGASLHARVPVPETSDEVRDLAVTLNSMLDRIESHDTALRTFTADASHELKSPVANLRALLDTSELDDPAWGPLRDRLAGESDRLRDLVENLLFLATHQAGKPTTPLEPVSLDDLVFDEAELLAATRAVEVDLSGVEPVMVAGRRDELMRLVRNLVDNAARHAHGRVALTTSARYGSAELAVTDDGPGVAPEHRERVFERFTRLDSARARDDGGSGLGLAIVRQIADDHDATVSIEDATGGGARFVVRFGERVSSAGE